MAKKPHPIAFEAALAELEILVGQLEQGELSLDQALQRFEQGVALARVCQTALRQAEQKVEQLLESDGEPIIAPFNAGAG